MTQRCVQGHEAARLQLVEQLCEGSKVAVERTAGAGRSDADLEELLVGKMHATGQIFNEKCMLMRPIQIL